MYEQMHDFLERNLPAYLDLLRQMVNINSFTTNVAGVNALGNLTAEAFAELGFRAERIQSVNPKYGRHLVLTRPGASDAKLGLVSHLDTVFPPEEEIRNNFAWRVEGDRIYGPGTVDIKGGTVMIYMILAGLKEHAPAVFDAVNWTVLLNASEETLSVDFGDLCLQRLSDHPLGCLVFEGGGRSENDFSIVVARKGMAIYRIKVEGRAAHAGSSHEQGANAVVQMSHTIQRIHELTDYERQLTFNVGTVRGGTVVNRVPHHAEALVEMRTFSLDVFRDGVAAMLALGNESHVTSASDGYPCRVDVEIIRQTEPWAPNPRTDYLFAVWQTAARTLGANVLREERGGLSDGNLVWKEIPTIDGLGPSGGNAHCSEASSDGSKGQEFVTASSFVPKAMLNSAAIVELVHRAEIV
jgi:glutamate carboxypeptidase